VAVVRGCHDSLVNSAERFVAASRAHDLDAAIAELSAEVVMLGPASDEPIVGREQVGAALRAVDAACDEFHHVHLLADSTQGAGPLWGLVFEARVGETRLQGVDLVEVDPAEDRIVRFTVMARPVSGLMALGARMSAQ
jgi:hypothetical protein